MVSTVVSHRRQTGERGRTNTSCCAEEGLAKKKPVLSPMTRTRPGILKLEAFFMAKGSDKVSVFIVQKLLFE